MNLQLKPEEMEILGYYDFLVNDDEEVMLVLPGYFKGEAIEARFLYDGGPDGILIRNRHQIIVCDAIHPDVREIIKKNTQILVFEHDSYKEYMAQILTQDIDECAQTALDIHDYGFSHYKFPIICQSLETGRETCSACGKETPVYLRSTDRSGNRTMICPECIQNKMAFKCGHMVIPDYLPEVTAYDKNLDILGSNPYYYDHGKPANIWGVHCEALGLYLGQLEPEDLNEKLKEVLTTTWDNEMNIYRDLTPEEGFNKLLNDECTCHLFKCAKCGQIFCIFFEGCA